MVKVDVSELKSFGTCKRQWQLSSRNRYHIRSKVTPPALIFGTQFHEALEQLYLGVDPQKVVDSLPDERALQNMVKKYAEQILPADLEQYEVLDLEHHFAITPEELADEDIAICGSVDMVVQDKFDGRMYAFEHKTCQKFREEAYIWMDEQPRVYTWAMKQYAAEKGLEFGGIYMNEVRKLIREFDTKRTLCTYSDEDLDNFMQIFFRNCVTLKHTTDPMPEPSYMSCCTCQYKEICAKFRYERIRKDDILEAFKDDFESRTVDHLEEKKEVAK